MMTLEWFRKRFGGYKDFFDLISYCHDLMATDSLGRLGILVRRRGIGFTIYKWDPHNLDYVDTSYDEEFFLRFRNLVEEELLNKGFLGSIDVEEIDVVDEDPDWKLIFGGI